MCPGESGHLVPDLFQCNSSQGIVNKYSPFEFNDSSFPIFHQSTVPNTSSCVISEPQTAQGIAAEGAQKTYVAKGSVSAITPRQCATGTAAEEAQSTYVAKGSVSAITSD